MESELVVRDSRLGRWYGYSEVTGVAARQREPLTPRVIVHVGLGPELRLVGESGAARLGSFVAGLDDRCAVIEHDGELRGVQLDLSPLAARRIFRVPMHELAGRAVALEELLGSEAGLLEERIAEAPSWEQRFALLERELGARLDGAEPPPADVDRAWRRLVTSDGRLRVGELARELGCSRKHLGARFRDHVGLPPKLVARILRFRRAADLLLEPEAPGLAQLAADCGYYDQAHLDRDFRDLAGTTPTAFAADPRDKVTFVQDDAIAAA
jgi:AraC-like DNA-binding protein